jgi:hypothetical protein
MEGRERSLEKSKKENHDFDYFVCVCVGGGGEWVGLEHVSCAVFYCQKFISSFF